MSQPNPLCVGIDVSKATLDIAASSDVAQFTVSNDSDGFNAIITGLRRHSVALVLMEATGGLEVAVACSRQAEGLRLPWSIPGRPVTSPVQWDILRRPTELMPESSRRWLRLLIVILSGNALSGHCRMLNVRPLLQWWFADAS
ncbi:transposase-like protein [Klebsiella pneumoniae]|nr:transposase-like protein [Klebsiella pneumoniae]